MKLTLSRLFTLAAIAISCGMSHAVRAADALESLRGEAVFAAPGNGTRSYLRTARGDFSQANFQAEVTVTIKGGGGNGCAYFGLGKGVANPASYNEPTTAPSICLRLTPNDFGGGLVSATGNGQEIGDGTAPVGDGTHRIRLTWDAAGKRALFEISKNWDGKHFHAESLCTVDADSIAFNQDAKLFIGGANGDKFSDLSIKPLTAEDIKNAAFGECFRNDPSAQTWMSPGNAAPANLSPEIAQLLEPLHGSMRLLSCWYNGAKLIASRPFTADGVRTRVSRWTSKVIATPVTGDKDALDVSLTFTLAEGNALPAGVAAAFDLNDWNTSNYVLIPASVYNGNRNRIVARGYAEGLDPKDYYRKDLPLTHGSVPCLAQEMGKSSKLEISACNASTPAVCVFDDKAKRGFILLAEQAGRSANGDFLRKPNGEIMDNSFAVEESTDRTRATVVVGAPGVRERKPEFMGFSASPDRGIVMKAGDLVTLRLRLYSFAAADIPAVLDKFMTVRKSLTGPNHPRDLLPASESERWMISATDNRFLSSPQGSFYCPENGAWIAFGWIGGWMDTFQMLVQGDGKRLERVSKTFDFGFKAQEPSGYFHYAINAQGNVAFREPKPDMNLSRVHGDLLYWMVKQFALLKAQGRGQAIKPEWEAGIRKLADACVTTWKKDGQWGKMVNVKTGDVSEYNTTGGAMIIGGLALASDYFKNPEYLTVAREAADYYYQRDFVKQGQTTGACWDILQNADSETAFGFTAALMALYDVTGDKTWLERSRNAANLAATWTVSYDYELPKFTALGAIGTRFAGACWASTQNKHAAPGVCTSSCDSMLKIYRATGDTRYAELMRDILRAHDEAFYGGGGSERLTYCDADSRGENPPGSNGWTETNGAMMAEEIPGIYLRTDQDMLYVLYVFDAVEVKTLQRDATGLTLQITNPTKFTARVAIFAESIQQAQKPLGYTAFIKWPKVEIKPGESEVVHVDKDGNVSRQR